MCARACVQRHGKSFGRLSAISGSNWIADQVYIIQTVLTIVPTCDRTGILLYIPHHHCKHACTTTNTHTHTLSTAVLMCGIVFVYAGHSTVIMVTLDKHTRLVRYRSSLTCSPINQSHTQTRTYTRSFIHSPKARTGAIAIVCTEIEYIRYVTETAI